MVRQENTQDSLGIISFNLNKTYQTYPVHTLWTGLLSPQKTHSPGPPPPQPPLAPTAATHWLPTSVAQTPKLGLAIPVQAQTPQLGWISPQTKLLQFHQNAHKCPQKASILLRQHMVRIIYCSIYINYLRSDYFRHCSYGQIKVGLLTIRTLQSVSLCPMTWLKRKRFIIITLTLCTIYWL